MEKEAQVGNAADQEQVKKAALTEKRRKEREESDLRKILSFPEGRRLYWKWMETSGATRTSVSHSFGSNETFFREGERNIAIRMRSDALAASVDLYILMQKEALEEEFK